MLSRILLIFTAILLWSSTALANCNGRVRVVNTDIEDGKVLVTLHVYASRKQDSRIVFYSLFGEVRVQTQFGGTMLTSFNHSGSATIEGGEDYAEEEVEIWAGPLGPAIESPRIRQVLAMNCYVQ